MRLSLLDEVILVGAGNGLAAGTAQVCFRHAITIPRAWRRHGVERGNAHDRSRPAVHGDPVPDDVLERILDNARFAPSGGVPLGKPERQVSQLTRRSVTKFVTRERFDGDSL
jgi:nitroreductase